jgi:hypothetical protein
MSNVIQIWSSLTASFSPTNPPPSNFGFTLKWKGGKGWLLFPTVGSPSLNGGASMTASWGPDESAFFLATFVLPGFPITSVPQGGGSGGLIQFDAPEGILSFGVSAGAPGESVSELTTFLVF